MGFGVWGLGFGEKIRIFVRNQLMRSKRLVRTKYDALEAIYAYNACLVCVSDLLRKYSTTFARKRLMRSKRLVRTKYDCCA